jgi:SAM-dependent methyltransferase
MLPRLLKKLIRRGLRAMPMLERQILPSAGYCRLSRAEAETFNARAQGWHSTRSAHRQEAAYTGLLARMHAGQPRADIRVAADAVSATGLAHPSLLDIGCGNGYYAEIFDTMLPGTITYTGLDYSGAMIERAKALYPGKAFAQGDATALAWPNGAFDIAFNGVSLMHILDYENAIAEAARVARSHVILHCVPAMEDCRTSYLSKYAYGEPVIEIIFSLQELTALAESHGLRLLQCWDSIPYDVFHALGHHSRMVTMLFTKVAP